MTEEKEKKSKSTSYVYWVQCSLKKIQVCKTTFINLHGISSDRVRRLCNLLAAGVSPQDKRGRNRPGNAKPFYVIKAIEDHIKSFPLKEAHYTSRYYRFLNSKLNVNIMSQMFITDNPTMKNNVDYRFYLKIFNENFDLKFGQPQVDTCC